MACVPFDALRIDLVVYLPQARSLLAVVKILENGRCDMQTNHLTLRHFDFVGVKVTFAHTISILVSKEVSSRLIAALSSHEERTHIAQPNNAIHETQRHAKEYEVG